MPGMSDERLKKLLGSYLEFLSRDVENRKYVEEAKDLHEYVRRHFLDLVILDNLTEGQLYDNLVKYTRRLAGPKILYGERRLKAFMPQFRKAMEYIVNSLDPVEVKLSNVISADGKLFFSHIGKQFWSPIFAAIDPEKWPNWNSRTDSALASLGFESEKDPNSGRRYKRIAQVFMKLKNLEPRVDFLKIDHFMHYVESVPEGRDLRAKLLEKQGSSPTLSVLRNKKQAVLYGPPGTGKTYNTKKIAMALIEDLYLAGGNHSV